MNAILGFFSKYALVILGALLLGSIVFHQIVIFGLKGHIKSQDETITQLNEKNGKLEGQNAVLTFANKGFKDLTKKQNDQIEQFKTEEASRKAEYQKNMDSDKKEIEKWKGAYQFLHSTRPADPKDQCSAFADKLNRYIELRQKELQP